MLLTNSRDEAFAFACQGHNLVICGQLAQKKLFYWHILHVKVDNLFNNEPTRINTVQIKNDGEPSSTNNNELEPI